MYFLCYLSIQTTSSIKIDLIYFVFNLNKYIFSILTESSGLTLSLEKDEDIANSDGALDVTDDGTLGVHELDADLGYSTTGASAADDLGDGAKLGLVSNCRGHFVVLRSLSLREVIYFFYYYK